LPAAFSYELWRWDGARFIMEHSSPIGGYPRYAERVEEVEKDLQKIYGLARE
jgi:hypothetical protein